MGNIILHLPIKIKEIKEAEADHSASRVPFFGVIIGVIRYGGWELISVSKFIVTLLRYSVTMDFKTRMLN